LEVPPIDSDEVGCDEDEADVAGEALRVVLLYDSPELEEVAEDRPKYHA